ncbi:Transposase IS3/IS911, probable orf B (plasmid) [Erwinia sp. Ejp617]|nr:Transposase IS3/IS911, probable orf B [Erwinia sp. Ejp617]
MKYVFIEKNRAEFSIKAMCRVFRIARSGWYVWCLRRHQISPRQQFRLICDKAVGKAFTEANSVMARLVLLTSCRSTTSKPLPPACDVRGCGRKRPASSVRSVIVNTACPCQRTC